jgi:type IV secretory pathway VirB3-like protein
MSAPEPNEPAMHTVHTAILKPLLMLGVEQRLFGVAFMMGGLLFTLAHSLLLGLGAFALGYAFAWWASSYDPEMLRIVFGDPTLPRYDAAKHDRFVMEVRR